MKIISVKTTTETIVEFDPPIRVMESGRLRFIAKAATVYNYHNVDYPTVVHATGMTIRKDGRYGRPAQFVPLTPEQDAEIVDGLGV